MKPTTSPKTYRVKSFGCQMNVYDGERMAEMLGERGIVPAPEGEDADLVVLNTCHIREKAAEKVYSDIGRISKAGTEAGKQPLIAVAGCVAQAEGEEIMKRSPAVSMVVGPQAYHRLPEMLDKGGEGRARDRYRHGPQSPSSPRCPSAAAPLRRASSPCRKAATSSAPIAWCPIPAARKFRGLTAIW